VRFPHLYGIAFGFGFALLGCEAEPRAALSTACVDASDRDACTRFGGLLERGQVPALFPEEPGVYYALGCEEGSLESCLRAQPWAMRYSDYEALDSDVGCMLRKNAFACEELARNLRGDTPNRSETVVLATSRLARALSLYLAGCTKGEAASCLGAARVHRSGLGDPPNLLAAEAEELKACALGLSLACEVAGDRRAASEAITLYRKACDLPPSLPHACLKLAQASEIIGAPPAAVLGSYRHACELLSADACHWLSRHAASLDQESPAIRAALQRFCDSDSAWACASTHPQNLPVVPSASESPHPDSAAKAGVPAHKKETIIDNNRSMWQ
jgi:TPR repeat protein